MDRIELKKGKREFITHTGYIGTKRITIISTGTGTDNVDIVLNELDALVNIDFDTRTVKPQLHILNIIRIGTSGAVQADIKIDSLLVSTAAFGLDPLTHYYDCAITAEEHELLQSFKDALPAHYNMQPYLALAYNDLLNKLANGFTKGNTITVPCFYAPQGRQVRGVSATPHLMQTIQDFRFR